MSPVINNVKFAYTCVVIYRFSASSSVPDNNKAKYKYVVGICRAPSKFSPIAMFRVNMNAMLASYSVCALFSVLVLYLW